MNQERRGRNVPGRGDCLGKCSERRRSVAAEKGWDYRSLEREVDISRAAEARFCKTLEILRNLVFGICYSNAVTGIRFALWQQNRGTGHWVGESTGVGSGNLRPLDIQGQM